jgi:hypothetical protein
MNGPYVGRYGGSECVVEKLRGKHDLINATTVREACHAPPAHPLTRHGGGGGGGGARAYDACMLPP